MVVICAVVDLESLFTSLSLYKLEGCCRNILGHLMYVVLFRVY